MKSTFWMTTEQAEEEVKRRELGATLEFVLWGLPKGSTDRIDEKVLYTQGKTLEQIEAVKIHAAADGWHSFRVQVLDLDEKPDFSKGVSL